MPIRISFGFYPIDKEVPMTDNLAVVDTWDLGNGQLSRCQTMTHQADAAHDPPVHGSLAPAPAQGVAHPLMSEHGAVCQESPGSCRAHYYYF